MFIVQLALAVLFCLVYVRVYLVSFPLTQHYRPQATFGTVTFRDPTAAFVLGGAALLLVALNALMWFAAQRQADRRTLLLIIATWLICSIMLLLTYPGQSNDWGDYTFQSHMLVHLGKNPLTTPPSAVIPFDAFPYLAWHRETSPYGPLWQAIAGVAHWISGEEIRANVLAFKLVEILATGAAGAFIYAILRRREPQLAQAGLAVWLCNPLVLNEGALNAHNDLALCAFALAAFWLVARGHGTLGIVALCVAGLIKFPIWILLPVLILWIVRARGWRDGLRSIVPGLLLGIAVVWLAYLPFGSVIRIRELIEQRGWWASGTWTAAIFYALREGGGFPHEDVVRVVIGSAILFLGVTALLILIKVHDLWLAAWAMVLAYLLLGLHWFQPWYGTLLIAFGALVNSRRVTIYLFVFSLFLLWLPIISDFKVSQLKLPPGGYDAVMAATTLLIPQLAALALALSALRRSSSPQGKKNFFGRPPSLGVKL